MALLTVVITGIDLMDMGTDTAIAPPLLFVRLLWLVRVLTTMPLVPMGPARMGAEEAGVIPVAAVAK